MVNSGNRWRSRSGKIKWGCLWALALVAGLGFAGSRIGPVYLRYWQMVDEMKAQARLAPGLENAVIRRRLVGKAEELGLPPEADKITIRRTTRPREIVITTSWQETVDLAVYKFTITFSPEARAQL